ncbi:MAG: hypothetical protein U9N13_04625 [Euryarchaeota archaeon]|nr:hypothetical protein [Euryarchaeota archaeon]
MRAFSIIVDARDIPKMTICALVLLLMAAPAFAADAATIHGAVYEWYTFEPLDDVLIEVNSTPSQSMVAKHGIYSMKLGTGDYLITAKYYQNSTLTAYIGEEISITDDGDYILDLLLLPAYVEDETVSDDLEQITESFEEGAQVLEEEKGSSIQTIAVILVLAIVAAAYLLRRNRSKKEEDSTIETKDPVQDLACVDEDGSEIDVNKGRTGYTHRGTDDETGAGARPLPEDLQEIVDMIRTNGGRITQKDLRTRLRYSEAKVSLMVADLENRGCIEKFKKGRGNVIIIPEEHE